MLKVTAVFLVWSILVSGCSVSQQKGFIQNNNTPETLNFRWGNSTAEVIETISKDGATLKGKYNIDVKDMVINQSNIQVLSYNNTEALFDSEFSHLNYLFLIPKLKVNENAELVAAIDFDQYLSDFSKAVPNANAEDFYRQPQMQQIMLTKAYEKFCYWVCLWMDEEIKVDQPLKEQIEVEFMGVILPEKSVTTHHGFHPEYDNKIKLTYTSTIKIDDAAELGENVANSLGFLPTKGEEEEIKGAEKINHVEVITDPETLKPDFVSYEMKIKIFQGDSKIEKTQKTIFEFKWLD